MYVVCINHLPLLFIPLNIIEYGVVYLIILVHAVYSHFESESSFILPLFIDSTYHKHHHQKSRGNYSVFFPIWDDFMKTRFSSPNVRLMNTKEKEKTKETHETNA
jgi:sterol desaturase/sphingolipid hydroxylase (fatty acid hydroxylase superfamily)